MIPDNIDIENVNKECTNTLVSTVKKYLVDLSDETKREMSTIDFLEYLHDTYFEFDQNIYDDALLVVTFDGNPLSFVLTEKLASFINEFDQTFVGLYHYALSYGSHKHNLERRLILSRKNLLDCFTLPYCHVLLVATSSIVSSDYIDGTKDLKLHQKSETIIIPQEIGKCLKSNMFYYVICLI